MGLRLLKDLIHALAIKVDPHCRPRVTEADLPAIAAAMQAAGLTLKLEHGRKFGTAADHARI